MSSAPVGSNERSYGESSRDSHSWSHNPSGAIRYTAPFGVRRSSRNDPWPPVPPETSTIEIDVISADTDGAAAPRPVSLGGRSRRSSTGGAAPAGRPALAP